MWLLDVNIPQQTTAILASFGIHARHTVFCGWQELKNGELVEAAVTAGFACIITRDRQFMQSARRALRRFPNFAVVILELPQLPKSEFVSVFRDTFEVSPIRPVPGRVISWPESPSKSKAE